MRCVRLVALCASALLLLLVVDVSGLVGLPPHARGGEAQRLREQRLTRHGVSLQKAQAVDYQYLQQPVDHFSPSSTETFTQRYVQVDTYWNKPTGPVLLYISGEDTMSGYPDGFITQVAQQNKALMVSLEHRYYGESYPTNRATANLTFLTTQQALADLAYFIDYYQANVIAPMGSQSNVWFAVGGSYAGALSAWFRLKYPNKVVGAWSSSGVVNAILNFTQFDYQVGVAAGDDCADAVRAVTQSLETDLAAGKPVKELFGAGHLDDPDFFYMTADSAAMAVQYGNKAALCSALVPAWKSGAQMSQVFANFTNTFWGASFGGQCFYDTACLQGLSDQSMARSWRWQKCYELAYLQLAPANNSLRSWMVNFTSQIDQCHQIFGYDIFPHTVATNDYYGGDHPNSTNIVFIDASDDPWQQASVRQQLSATEPFLYIQCDGCGHCMDLDDPLSSDPPIVTSVRQQVAAYVTQWISEASA